MRQVSGVVFLALGISGIALFSEWQTILGEFSPDGHVEDLTWAVARISLISLFIPGLFLLGFKKHSTVLRMFQSAWEHISQRRFLAVILSSALVLRILPVLLRPLILAEDYQEYDELAWRLATTGEYTDGAYPTAYYPPGWPYLLSRLYLIFGHTHQIGLFANVLLGVGCVFLTYRLTRIIWGETLARWAAIILTIIPSQVLMVGFLGSEPLFTFLFLLSILLLLGHSDTPVRWLMRVFLSGLILGLATLTRSLTLLFPVVLIPFFYLKFSRSMSMALWFALVIGLALVVGPWVVRNHNVMNRATVSTSAGVNFYIGNNPENSNLPMGYNRPNPEVIYLRDAQDEARDDSAGFAAGWTYIKNRPVEFIRRGAMKVAYFMLSDVDPMTSDLAFEVEKGSFGIIAWMTVFIQSVYMLLLCGCISGIIVYTRHMSYRPPGATILLGTILYWMAIHFVFYGEGRYHFPIVPMMAGFAALAIVSPEKRSGLKSQSEFDDRSY